MVVQALEHAQVPRQAMVAIVQEVGTTTDRLAWQPDQPAHPASLMKLLTTYAGLDLLGPGWTWRTPVWLDGELRDGVLEGNLTIQGRGDPTFAAQRLWALMQRVRQAGVRDIHGDIVLDRSAFSLPDHDPGEFDGESRRPYNVGADALLLNYKSVVLTITADPARGVAHIATDVPLAGVRVDTGVSLDAGPCEDWRNALRADFSDPAAVRFAGSFAAACGEKVWAVAYADPSTFNARAVLGIWQRLGGELRGAVREAPAPASAPTFELVSAPLADVIRDINKFSNNVMAQQLFLTLGWAQRGSGTPESARQVLSAWAADRWGPQLTAGLVVDNGSGLSRQASVSARLLARLLQSAWAGPWMPELMASLPISGLDGTLRRGPDLAGRAHLKTGSLRDVLGVAGYVQATTGRRYVVVGIVNHPNADAARPALDALVQWVGSTAAAP